MLNKDSTKEEWQQAYNQTYSHYMDMIHAWDSVKNSAIKDYRLEDECISWSHKMVDASLGATWQIVFSKVSPKKRAASWVKLKEASKWTTKENPDVLIEPSVINPLENHCEKTDAHPKEPLKMPQEVEYGYEKETESSEMIQAADDFSLI